MKEYILINKRTVEVGLGVPFLLFDGLVIEENPCFKVCLIDGTPDCWGVFCEKTDAYILLKPKRVEVIGEL